MKMALANCWPTPLTLQTDLLRSRNPTIPSSPTSKKEHLAYDRWSVDLHESGIGRVSRPNSSRKRSLASQDSIMPVTSGSQSLLAALPTFMSVFGDNSKDGSAGIISSSQSHSPVSSISHSVSRTQFAPQRKPSYIAPRSPSYYRRNSANTIHSDSTESSPTTTISTIDSTLTESSPSSSPDSPKSLLPISSLSSLKVATSNSDDDMYRAGFASSPSPNRTGFDRSDSPNKKPRNTKNLSVNTSSANRPSANSSLPRLATYETAAEAPAHASSAPNSPSFVIPVMPPKRKPSKLGLSITTSESSVKVPQNQSASDFIPQTPSFSRLSQLRHGEHAGGMQLFSPIGAPEGGMRLPPLGGFSNSSGSKLRPALSLSNHTSFDSTNSSPIVLQTLDHVPEEGDHDLPQSREVKSPAYPHGPVCIYPPSVYLYLEPNDSEAAKFDVVINVAREVLNPFVKVTEKPEPKTRDIGVQVDLMSDIMDIVTDHVEPRSAVSETSFQSAYEVMSRDSMDCPDTPKPAKDGPEYIHVPWEHNTKVSLELMELCELIDDRVNRGKRVLIHCQCGVSRSASLIIAYGLYKNPELSDSEAYNMVKERSRWINPNMHFIFELHAFKQMLAERNRRTTLIRRPGLSTGPVRTQTDSVVHPNTYPISPVIPVMDEPASAPLQDGFCPGTPPQDAFCLGTPVQHGLCPGTPLHDVFQSDSAPQRSAPLEPIPGSYPSMPSSAEITPSVPSIKRHMDWSPAVTSAAPWQDSVDTEMIMDSPPAPQTARALPQKREFEESHNGEAESASAHRGSTLEARPAPSVSASPARFWDLKPSLPSLSPLGAFITPLLRKKSSMPAGFSSLMSRRQGPRLAGLPFRTDITPPVPVPPPMLLTTNIPTTNAVPDSPSLLSPRIAEFTATPFHRTAAGDLAGTSFFEQALLSPRTLDRDPRSPAIKGEAPITRSIDDVL